MKNLRMVAGLGALLTAAGIAGGLGVALAHNPGDDPPAEHGMGGGAPMAHMDADTMAEPMRTVLGDEAHALMMAGMPASCPSDAPGMPATPAEGPGHEQHHEPASGG
jgi:hypothetical protein